ncbi:MAG: hypothetical protein COA96_14340, partial [SAR86 cluster bacterium]
MNRITLAKILLTIAAIQLGVIPPIVDFSTSHVFNLDWAPHAKLHMVWLLTTGGLLSVYVWVLLWLPAKHSFQRLRHACVPGWVVLTGFFVAAVFRDSYGGSLADPGADIEIMGISGNVISFSIAAIFQAAGTFIIW